MPPVKRVDPKRTKKRSPVTVSGGGPEAPRPGLMRLRPGPFGTGFSREVQMRVLLNQQPEWRNLDELVEDAFATVDAEPTSDGSPSGRREGARHRRPCSPGRSSPSPRQPTCHGLRLLWR